MYAHMCGDLIYIAFSLAQHLVAYNYCNPSFDQPLLIFQIQIFYYAIEFCVYCYVPDAHGRAVHSSAGDIYAFGILMFELATGLPVHPHLTAARVVQGVVHQGLRPAFPPASHSSCSDAYARLAQRCG